MAETASLPLGVRAQAILLASATLLGTGMARAAPPGAGDAPPPAQTPAPRPKHGNEAMMLAGIAITIAGVALVPIGLTLWLGTPSPPQPPCDTLCGPLFST